MTDQSDDYQFDEIKGRGSRKGQSFFSGNFAQLMVFFNGLILTLTAYFILSIFVSDIVDESLSRLPMEARSYINDEFSDLDQSLYALGVLISVAHEENKDDFREIISGAPIRLDDFSNLIWVSRQEDQWISRELYSKSKKFIDASSNNFSNFITSRITQPSSQAQLIVDFKNIETFESQNGNMQRPIGLVRAIVNDDQIITGYLIAVVELETVLIDWLGRQEALADLMVQYRDNFVSFPLYQFISNGQKNDNVHTSERFQVLLGSTPVFVSVGVSVTEREAFIRNIPFLLLLFGLSLTLIGTLYVRNNQKQSERLSTMNKTLAQKNFDLSVEMKGREKLNKAIKKAERENRAIINSVSDIIFETDTDGIIQFLNEPWTSITGIGVDESVGGDLFEYLYPQDQQDQKDNFKLLVQGKKQAYRSFTRIRTADGDYRAVELGVSMLRHDDDKNMHVVGTITDIEERKRTEQALGEAERKYRTIVENAAGGIYQISEDGQYLSANPAMARTLGYNSPKDLLASVRDVNRSIYKDTRKRSRFLRDIEDFKNTQTSEFEVYKNDGSVSWVFERTRAVVDDADRLMFYEGSMSDVTERKQGEIKLRDAKIQSDLASRAKSEFLTNMSHELRTPLNAIIGFSEIIKNQAFGPVGSDEYLNYAQDIHDGGKRLLNVINEILDVSRIEAGDRTINEGVVDLKVLAQGCLDLMGPKIEANDMIVTNSIAENFPNLIGEELAVKQMVMNLLSNAVKYTPNGGRVTISSELSSSGDLRLSITDTGVGLEDDEIEKALSPFGQIESNLSKSGSGTGLGLTLVDALIKLHEGRLELFSQKGIGTTATLIFPAKRVTKRSQAGHPTAVPYSQNVKKTEN
ncbi:MAG: PAS domain-containing sensor histidine kinase [Pseudomonadota bacterium]